MRTVIYWPTFVGALGTEPDFCAVVTLMLETLTASNIELLIDSDPARPQLEHLFDEIRQGRVDRVLLRNLCDLCLTTTELSRFIAEVTENRVKVETIFDVLPSVLLLGRPELLGRFRHRQVVAKVLRLRRLGFKVAEICALARCTPQKVNRILSRPR
jgi:hypothetical protein